MLCGAPTETDLGDMRTRCVDGVGRARERAPWGLAASSSTPTRGTAFAERRRRLRSVVDARAVPGTPAPGGSADKRLKLVYLYSVRNPPPGKHLPDAAPLTWPRRLLRLPRREVLAVIRLLVRLDRLLAGLARLIPNLLPAAVRLREAR